ncbi:GNAT family N-acetyltransferase [Microbispora sp. ATCC PTA-5024]|uniref:GNAT family N-acetyltransferase n=1 Tax=Microbispora sp. ATCC PTA-5024 TaxID=316330 RepID=UPI0009FFA70C
MLYVDDLVTDPGMRRMGAGRASLAWLERAGVAAGCPTIELVSAVTRSDASVLRTRRPVHKRFSLRQDARCRLRTYAKREGPREGIREEPRA